MLKQVLHEIEQARSSISISELSHRLGVEADALEGMIQFWVRKGRLKVDNDVNGGANCSCGTGANNCAPVSDCIFIAKMPKSYTIQD